MGYNWLTLKPILFCYELHNNEKSDSKGINITNKHINIEANLYNGFEKELIFCNILSPEISSENEVMLIKYRKTPSLLLFLYDENNNLIDIDVKFYLDGLIESNNQNKIIIGAKCNYKISLKIERSSYLIPTGKYNGVFIYIQDEAWIKDPESNIFTGILKSNYFNISIP